MDMEDAEWPLTADELEAVVGRYWAQRLITRSAICQLVFFELVYSGASFLQAWCAMEKTANG